MDSYEKFLVDLKRHLDLDLTGYKRPQMERRINTLMRSLGEKDYDSFIQSMLKDRQRLERFTDHLTINVSEFFRNEPQWQVMERQILPRLLAETSDLKIWSAGCSTGEEPYTMAMILQQIAPAGKYSILATDFDDRVLRKAEEGYYSKKSVAGIPRAYLEKYFIANGNAAGEGFRVRDELKKNITFRHHNLLRDKYPDRLDLIICRNVVIYFTLKSVST